MEVYDFVKNNIKFKNNTDINQYNLTKNYLDVEDISAAINVLLSGQITMSKNVELFEKEFAEYVGSKYAIMVNSGSSANLLAVSVITNKCSNYNIPKYSEILVPSVCWSTSVWPLIQCNLKPIFVDCNPKTLNINLIDLENKITSHTKGILLVHVLGNCCNMTKLMNIINKYNLVLIEDTCEALGSKYKNKMLGTFGNIGTFSFYYSHHITTGEGGMIVCDNYDDYILLKILRSHGWSRDISQKDKKKLNTNGLNKNWIFINQGYNLRSTDINAAIGRTQLKKLDNMIKIRCLNRNKIKNTLYTHNNYNNQLIIIENNTETFTSWFGLCFMINKKYINKYRDYLRYLNTVGIENRPIISGNFLRQPATKLILNDIYESNELYKLNPELYEGAEIINNRCFYIGLHPIEISNKECNILVNKLLDFYHIKINNT
tara:strand:+ start:1360 stop:2655 length:1296 start_codon:yes stop_codon:yes gene_type:complete